MWQIRRYDLDDFFEGKYENMQLIKEVENEPDTDRVFEIDGKLYRWCATSPKNKVIAVEEVKLLDEKEAETQYEEDFTCPYCEYVDYDAFELEEHGTIECDNCGSTIEYEREYTVHYRVYPVKRNQIIKL